MVKGHINGVALAIFLRYLIVKRELTPAGRARCWQRAGIHRLTPIARHPYRSGLQVSRQQLIDVRSLHYHIGLGNIKRHRIAGRVALRFVLPVQMEIRCRDGIDLEFIKGECADVVDFAEAMVWRHNEELAKLADDAIRDGIVIEGNDIREAKP